MKRKKNLNNTLIINYNNIIYIIYLIWYILINNINFRIN